MTAVEAEPSRPAGFAPALFTLTVFTSAALVFAVQPMIGRLILPQLGGSPAVWNTSMAFFQAALLAGYAYAHALQRIASLKRQAAIHLTLLALAAIALPLHVTGLLGEPTSTHPILWLIGVLAVSIGAPFAVLSATAPLVQAWHARLLQPRGAGEPYALYAASNLGSFLALIAYPIVIEPTLTLSHQRTGWSLAYGGFALLMAVIAVLAFRLNAADAPVEVAKPASWRQRLTWLALAAIPASLMLGVTAHLATDVASAPFLWVAPLALYLLTFVIAFQAKPIVPPWLARLLQAGALVGCVAMTPARTLNLPLQIVVHLGAFFLTALVCHQALVARRPASGGLTEFYLWMSLGGVVGGALNAFVAPVIFNDIYEYPVVLALAALVRPWGGTVGPWRWANLITAVATSVGGVVAAGLSGPDWLVKSLFAGSMLAAYMIRDRALLFFGAVVVLSFTAWTAANRVDVTHTWRSFFGVLKESRMPVAGLGGETRMLAHGTTLHGAQAQDPRYRCRPLVYYAPETAIGQVFTSVSARRAAARVGAVGLGTGSVAAYSRKGDRLTFFEIDPLVVRISMELRRFDFVTRCAYGAVDFRLGDARLTLAKEPPGSFDLLLIDAFSSDSVPAHLMTVEAMRMYLSKLKPDGIVILHLSNRNLELRGPAQAVARAAGGRALIQRHLAATSSPPLWESDEDVLIAAKSREALAPYIAHGGWQWVGAVDTKPWTDDYTNVFGALMSRMKERWAATSQ